MELIRRESGPSVTLTEFPVGDPCTGPPDIDGVLVILSNRRWRDLPLSGMPSEES